MTTFPDITVVMIDSRSNTHPHWVQAARKSVETQIYPVRFIVVDNTDLSKTIGHCWNEAVKKADAEWILFFGDDDWLSPDYTATLAYWASRTTAQWISTYMTIFAEDGPKENVKLLPRMCTGMIKRDYLLSHPFDETLKGGVDKAFYEKAALEGVHPYVIHYHYGYHYRQHDVHRARPSGSIPVETQTGDLYVVSRYLQNSQLLIDRFKAAGVDIVYSNKFDGAAAQKAKVIWCEWGDRNAAEIADFDCDARKVLRVRAYEVFTPMIHYIDFDRFDEVIFVADHIKEYAERQVGKIGHAQVIPNAVDMEQFRPPEGKPINNKVCFAGELSRKKGLQLLLLTAEHFPEYEFHVAGKFPEADMAEYFLNRAPGNVFFDHYRQGDLNDYFADKTYFLLPSPREGCNMTTLQAMAAGLMPLVYDHVGAGDVFPGLTWRNHNELKALFDRAYHIVSSGIPRRFVERYHDIEKIFPKYLEMAGYGNLESNYHREGAAAHTG